KSNVKNTLSDADRDISYRKDRVGRLCKQFHLGKYKWGNNTNDLNLKEPPTPLFAYFFWNRERHVAWCPVYKAGSTSWLQNMMRLAGYSEGALQNPPKQLSIWAREVYGDADNFGKDEIAKSLKLLVVRHPFERLLSAYRDKLANSTVGNEHGTHHFYLKYGKRIVQKFRNDPSKRIHQIEPTWEEFVRYILKTDLLQYADDHWIPAYYSCTPCLVEYDVIAKTETYFRDQQFIIKKAGLEEILKPRWSHSTQESQSRLQLRKQYFSQLTKTQVKQLYDKYKLDFLLFGYDYEEYVKLAKKW
ncbi:Carbohydrate sulfotransferase 13, partial [Orchesella cincta]